MTAKRFAAGLRLRAGIAPITLCAALACGAGAAAQDAAGDAKWVSLLNGKDLDGWTPKVTGYEAGVNYADTFRVEDGVLKVGYDKYPRFDGKFGHLYSRKKYSNYRLRIEYRFTGGQCPGGPGWAFRNSGVMIHSQPPETLRKDQEFPVSVEVQFLGGDGKAPRTTGNVCTPGTHIVVGGKLITRHCTDSTSKTYHGDQWVSAEVEVHGDGAVKHVINGETVLTYEKPQLDPGDADARKRIEAAGGEKMLKEGHIALQAESHPVEFRKVEILELDR